MKHEIIISTASEEDTLRFAAQELARYLQRMGNAARTGSAGGIVLAAYPQQGHHCADDAFTIEIEHGQGRITGPAPRSVLLGVYRYLTLCGCTFLFPGANGERIPCAPAVDCHCCEAASFRYRCISIEGANARENVLEMINWMPKVGLNSYHIQLLDGFTFYDRWYSHARNPHKEAQQVTPSQTAAFLQEAVAQAKLRGLMVQYMGHGWTGEPFGLHAKGWEREALQVPPETLALLAMVNGERQVWKSIPVDTNACYSNPKVRRRMAEFVANFAAQHSQTELLHVWLADDCNNYCECAACAAQLPSDWYVALLNEVDAQLTAQGLPTRIVFLVYSELLWAPLTQRFSNSDRFVLIFAPVSLDYTQPFTVPQTLPPTKPFVLNNITLPDTSAENISHLRTWQNMFHGDSFVYLYHLLSCGWEKDIAGLFLSKIMRQDILNFGALGFQGTSSCQAQRSAFPTGLVQYVMARTLWCKTLSWEALLEEYFFAAYGAQWQTALGVLEDAQAFFPPEWLQGKAPRQCDGAAERFSRVQPWAQDLLPTLHTAVQQAGEAHRCAWRLLQIYVLLLAEMGPLFEAIARGAARSKLRADWEAFVKTLFSYEDELHFVFDMEWFVRNFELFEIRGLRHFVNDAPPWED